MIFKSTTLFVLLAFFMSKAFSQTNNDFIIIDEIAENVSVVENQFIGQSNIYHTKGIDVTAFKQISQAMANKQVEELHIYVPTKPGALVFSNQSITPENISKFSQELSKWRMNVNQRIIIHSEVVFNGDDGALLKQLLEESTGLTFVAIK